MKIKFVTNADLKNTEWLHYYKEILTVLLFFHFYFMFYCDVALKKYKLVVKDIQ